MTSAGWIPRSRGGRIRLATLAFGLLLISMQILQLDSSRDNGGVTALSATAVAVLDCLVLTTAIIRRPISIWEAPAAAALTTLVGVGLAYPLGVMAVCIGVIVAESMYGGRVSVLIRAVSFLPVVPLSVGLSVSSISAGLSWHSPSSLSLVPAVALFAVLADAMRSTLESQAQATVRVRFMAKLTGDLLACGTWSQLHQLLGEASAELARITPGLVVVLTRQEPPDSADSADSATPEPVVLRLHGATPAEPLTRIPADVIAQVPPPGGANLHELKGIGARMEQLGLPATHRWYVHRGDVAGATINLAFLGLPMTLPERLFRTRSAQAAEVAGNLDAIIEHRRLALAYLEEKQTLIEAARRDDVTGLPKRSAFLAELESRAEAGTSVLLVGIDGISELAVRNGLPDAAVVASRLGRRLIETVGDRSLTGRFSDNRFAIAVPPGDPDRVSGLSESLRQALATPVPLGEGAVCLAVSIGIGSPGAGPDGVSATELLQRAALALRQDRDRVAAPLVRQL